jgi:glucose/arabinose dehydrogenase
MDYDRSIISNDTARAGMVQPVIYWKPSIAPCGMTFVTNDKFKEWKGDLIVGSLKFMYLQHLVVKGSKVVSRGIISIRLAGCAMFVRDRTTIFSNPTSQYQSLLNRNSDES